jgi:hypothetical protein
MMSGPARPVSGRPVRVTMPVVHADLQVLRVRREAHPDQPAGHLAADLLVRPSEDAEHVDLADDPDQVPALIHHRQPADRPLIHEEGSITADDA